MRIANMAKIKGKAGIRVTIDAQARTFTILVKQGEEILAARTFQVDRLPSEIALEAQLRGTATVLQQRVSDVEGTALDKLDQIAEVWEMWMNGDYRAEKSAGTRLVKPIFEVLAKERKTSIGAIQVAWAKISEEKRKAYEEKYAAEIQAVLESRKLSDEIDL
jgi:hypothetical protein